jgi:NAD(P)H dehydrogenase (quinone)
MSNKNIKDMQCLIIIAHPNRNSIENNKILNTIKRTYIRAGFNVNIANLCNDVYNPFDFVGNISNMKNNAFSKSYRHLVKTSHHIVIISPTRWLSLSPLIEGFIDQVFTNNFAFKNGKPMFTEKKLMVITTSNSIKSLKWKSLNLLWVRLRVMIFPQFFKFKNIRMYQIWNVKDKTGVELNNDLSNINKIIDNLKN